MAAGGASKHLTFAAGYQREGTVDTTAGVVTGTANNDTLNFDASGNRTSVVDNGTTTYYSLTGDNLNQYRGITGVAPPTYDAKGNLLTYDIWTYTYDAMNRLTQASATGTSAYFYYDGLNRQVARHINNEIKFDLWDGWNL